MAGPKLKACSMPKNGAGPQPAFRGELGRVGFIAGLAAPAIGEPKLGDSSDGLSKLFKVLRLKVVGVRSQLTRPLLMIRIIRSAEDYDRQRPQFRPLSHPFDEHPTIAGH